MTIYSARLWPYDLPLHMPWQAARTQMPVRRGHLLAIRTDDGLTGWGDCAPLPSSPAEQRAAIEKELCGIPGFLEGMEAEDVLYGDLRYQASEVGWAVETAVLDLLAQRHGRPLACQLGAKNFNGRLGVNAALGALGENTCQYAVQAWRQGFRHAKIKVGLHAPEQELVWLRKIHQATHGRLQLRLDANRAWPLAVAGKILDALAGLSIEAVEEPLACTDPETLRGLQGDLPFALAIDESLSLHDLERLFARPPVRRLVIKPARLGGLLASMKLAGRAREAGMEVVFTSVVDSAVGVSAGAHLAACVAPGMAHGFATLPWLVRDVAPGPRLVQGHLILGEATGHGIRPAGGEFS